MNKNVEKFINKVDQKLLMHKNKVIENIEYMYSKEMKLIETRDYLIFSLMMIQEIKKRKLSANEMNLFIEIIEKVRNELITS